MADLEAHIAKLNPFSRKKETDDEDKVADLVVDALKQHERRVSEALQSSDLDRLGSSNGRRPQYFITRLGI